MANTNEWPLSLSDSLVCHRSCGISTGRRFALFSGLGWAKDLDGRGICAKQIRNFSRGMEWE